MSAVAPEFSRLVALAQLSTRPFRQRIRSDRGGTGKAFAAVRPHIPRPPRGRSGTPASEPRGDPSRGRICGGVRAVLRGYPRAGPRRRFPTASRWFTVRLRKRSRKSRSPATNRRSSPSMAIRSISGRRSRRNSPWCSRSFRAIPRRGSIRRRWRNRCRGLLQGWRGCGRMRNVEILVEPFTVPELRLSAGCIIVAAASVFG